MELPVGHVGGPPLYGKMMRSISRGHSIGNTIRMLKLPLISLPSCTLGRLHNSTSSLQRSRPLWTSTRSIQ